MEERNAGYLITEKISLQKGTYVLGHHPGAPAPYVTWEVIASGSYWQGHYFTNEADARNDLFIRAIRDMPMEQSDHLALSILSDEARDDILRQDREDTAWSDIESCFYPAAEYLGMSDTASQKLLVDPKFREAAFRVFWNQDHSYENEALQESLENLIQDQFGDRMKLSHEEIYEEIANHLDTELRNGEAANFIDVCAEQKLNQKGYMLVVWGEENDTDDKFFSVSVYSLDKYGDQDKQILYTFSDSESFEDLKVSVLDVLKRFDAYLLEQETGKTTQSKNPLDAIIQSAAARQGREEKPQLTAYGQTLLSHMESLYDAELKSPPSEERSVDDLIRAGLQHSFDETTENTPPEIFSSMKPSFEELVRSASARQAEGAAAVKAPDHNKEEKGRS